MGLVKTRRLAAMQKRPRAIVARYVTEICDVALTSASRPEVNASSKSKRKSVMA